MLILHCVVKEWKTVNVKLGETNVKWINQHVMSVGQRKKLALFRENNVVSVFLKKFKTMLDFSLVLLTI